MLNNLMEQRNMIREVHLGKVLRNTQTGLDNSGKLFSQGKQQKVSFHIT